jgi:hypothetical protein
LKVVYCSSDKTSRQYREARKGEDFKPDDINISLFVSKFNKPKYYKYIKA